MMKKKTSIVATIVAVAILLAALWAWQSTRQARGTLDEGAQSEPWYPLLGQVFRHPAAPGVYWCMFRREQPFVPCPQCVMVCNQSLYDSEPAAPRGVFLYDAIRIKYGEEVRLAPAPVSMVVTPDEVLVNGRSAATLQDGRVLGQGPIIADVHAELAQAVGRHRRDAKLLEFEPDLRASLVVSPATRSELVIQAAMTAVGAEIHRVELGIEAEALSLPLRCRPSEDIDVHLFDRTIFGNPRRLDVLAGAEGSTRWLCEEPRTSPKSSPGQDTYATFATYRWAPVHDNRARQRQMMGPGPSNSDEDEPRPGQVLIKIGAPGFSVQVGGVPMPAVEECKSEDPAFLQNATICVQGAHPEEIVKMVEAGRRAYVEGNDEKGRAEIERVVGAYDFESLRRIATELGEERGEDSLLLIGVDADVPAAVLAGVLDVLHHDDVLFKHVVVAVSRF